MERLVPRGPFRADPGTAGLEMATAMAEPGQEIVQATRSTADNVTKLRTEADIAADLKVRARDLLGPLCALMDEARSVGVVLNFQVGANGFGKHSVQDVTVVKPL